MRHCQQSSSRWNGGYLDLDPLALVARDRAPPHNAVQDHDIRNVSEIFPRTQRTTLLHNQQPILLADFQKSRFEKFEFAFSKQ